MTKYFPLLLLSILSVLSLAVYSIGMADSVLVIMRDYRVDFGLGVVSVILFAYWMLLELKNSIATRNHSDE